MFRLVCQTYNFNVDGLAWRIYFERAANNCWEVTADNGLMEKFHLGIFADSANTEKFCNTMLQLLIDKQFIKS